MTAQFTEFENNLLDINNAVDVVAAEVAALITKLPPPGTMTVEEDAQFRADMQATVQRLKAIPAEPA